MNQTLIRVSLHSLELFIALSIAYIAKNVFGVDNEVIIPIVTLILSAAAKFARDSDLSPVPDYVNGKESS